MIPHRLTRSLFLVSGLLFLVGCLQSYRHPVIARFDLFPVQKSGGQQFSQRVDDQPASGDAKVRTEKSSFEIIRGELNVTFLEKGAGIEFTPKAAGLPVNWDGFTKLDIDASCKGRDKLTLVISVLGPRGVLCDTFTISKGSTLCSLNLADLPLTSGNNPPYEPEMIRIAPETAPAEVTIHSVRLNRSVFMKFPVTVVDRFGQRKNKDWPGKVKSEEDLIHNRIQEESALKQKLRDEWDEFGGWKKGPQLEGTGYFRVTRLDDRYWFVTPGGRLMWSFGVTGIRPNAPMVASTKVSGREFLFESLPPRTGKETACWTSSGDAGFYCWNILRKYNDLQPWRESAFRRLDAWGYNTIGNWSEPELLKQAHFPFTVSFNSTVPGVLTMKGIADVFNPLWETGLDSIFRQAVQWSDNPFLLGYFVDNEAGWGEPDLLTSMPPDSWSRLKWLEFIQQKYPTLSELNTKWRAAFKDWRDVQELMTRLDNQDFLQDYTGFETRFAEEYFKQISSHLKKYDPGHLYLGCRFTRRIKPEHICRTAGKYCDVITVNVYARTPSEEIMGEWYRRTGKPILIGEHHINLASTRQVPARWGASTPVERREYYSDYVETWANLPYSLGCHWYQFSDQEITGRSSNGENQPVGLVDITDQPHNELIETAQILSGKIYSWHLQSLQGESTKTGNRMNNTNKK